MQMRKFLYEQGSPLDRAARHRDDAIELRRRGFPGLADVNDELAAWLEYELELRESKREANGTD